MMKKRITQTQTQTNVIKNKNVYYTNRIIKWKIGIQHIALRKKGLPVVLTPTDMKQPATVEPTFGVLVSVVE